MFTPRNFLFCLLTIVFLIVFPKLSFAQNKCIDLGTGIGLSNGEMAFINFFKDGGKWEPIGNNNHPWYKVYSLDTFKVVNGAYYNWDIDWSGTVNNEAWGNDWADCFISYWDMLVDQGKIRPDGYPVSFPLTVYKYKPKSVDPNQGIDLTKPVSINRISRRIYFPNGLTSDGWILRWKGKGRISFEGMEVTSANVPYTNNGNSWTPDGSYAGRNYTFTSTSGGRVVNRHFWMVHGWVLNIIESDPSDPIRDIEYLYPGCESIYDGGQRFTPLFIERMRQFKSLRFMGYLNSNGIESRRTMAEGHPYENSYMLNWLQWKERTPDNYYQINNGNGGNYEAIIDLANQTGIDPWVNIPYCAGEEYVDSLVRLFMEKLNPDLTLYLEVGNELWNFAPGFDGFFWHARLRVREYPGLGDVEARGAHLNRIFKKVTETAGTRNLSRIQRVFAGFPRYYDVNNRTAKMINPDYWDAFATTWYFNLSSDNSASNPCLDPATQTNWRSVLYNWYLAHPNDQAGFNQFYRDCLLKEFRCSGGYRNNTDAQLAKYYNKKLICYEGGNHTFYGCENGPTGDALNGEGPVFSGAVYPNYITNNGFINAVCVADESNEMGQVFNEVIDSLQAAGYVLADHLSFSGSSSCYGVWDLIQSRDIEAPLSTLLSRYAKFRVFSERIKNDNCSQVNIILDTDTVGPGLSIKLDGINDYIEGQTSFIPDESSNYTLEAWIKPYYLDKDQVVLSFSSDGADDNYNVIKVRSDKRLVWETGNNGVYAAKLVGTELVENNWYHIAISKNGTRYTLYLNGVNIANNNFSLGSTIRNRYTIGALYKGTVGEQNFSGEVDEVRLWNLARTVDEIRASMCRKIQSGNSGLRSYYTFNTPDYISSWVFDNATQTTTGHLRNITITERSRYSTSGAPVGDISSFVYPSTWSGTSLSLTHPEGDLAAVYNIAGNLPSGMHLYMINGQSHFNDLPPYYTDISNKRVVGVFAANGLNTNFDFTYRYSGNPDALTGGGEENLRLLRRNDYSIANWLHSGAQINLTNQSLTIPCKEKYRGEFNLAHRQSVSANRPGSGKALLDSQPPTGNVMGKVQYLNMDDYTVAFWAKGWGEAFRLTSKLNANSASFTIGNYSTNYISCGFRYGVHWTYDVSFDVNTAIGLNTEWHHYAITKNGTKIRIYVDGAEMTSGDITSTFHVEEMYLFNAPSWQVGNFQGGRSNLTLDELSVWNISLQQETIREWMCKKITSRHPNECENLVLYFNFDENSGTVLEDRRGPSDIVLSTDNSGFQWVTSGAAVGNVSIADYSSPENIVLAHPDGDSLVATRTTGTCKGVHLYRMDNTPPEPAVVNNSSIQSLDSSRYWGLFIAKTVNATPGYTLVNRYQNNSRIDFSNESTLRFLSRSDNAATTWNANLSVLPDVTSHTLTLTGQNRGEYILGGTSLNTFRESTAPQTPVFRPTSQRINRETICGNSTGLIYQVEQNPDVISYIWLLPHEFTGYSTSDSIIISANYRGSGSKSVVISVIAVNNYGQSAPAYDTITVLTPPTIADAGPDQILIPPTLNTVMAANSPLVSEIATWIQSFGSANITDIHNPATTVNNIGTGVNRFAWNIDNSVCPVSTDTMQIIVAPSPTGIVLANGDPLPNVFCAGQALTIRAIAPEDIVPDSYQWTMPSGITLLNQSGSQAIIQIGNGIGGTIQVAAIYSGNASLPFVSQTVNINPQPVKPAFIAPPATLCLNVDVEVSISPNPFIDSVEWILPYGIYPVDFPKSTSERINIQAIDVMSGYIKAKTFNNGCTNPSAIDSFIVNVASAPPKPELYLGTDGGTADAVCGTDYAILWVRNPQPDVLYEWRWGTSVDFVQYFGDNRSGAMFYVHDENTEIEVRAVTTSATCNTSEWFNFYAWPQNQGPAQITNIAITNPAQQNTMSLQQGQTYTFTVTGNGTNYYWNLPQGFSLINDGDYSNSVNQIRVDAATAGYLQVFPITLRGCAGNPFTLNIGTSGALLPPVYVSGNLEICQGSNLAISISAVNGTTGYIWTLPDGSVFNTATNSINQTISSSMNGLLTVVATNGIAQSTPLELELKVSPTFLTSRGFVNDANQPITELEVCNGDYRKPVYFSDILAGNYKWEIHGSAIEFNPRYEPGYENNGNYELLNRTSSVDTMMSINWVDWRCRKDGTDGGYIVVTAFNGCGGPNVKDSIPYFWSQPLNILVPEFTVSPSNACVGSKINFEIKPILNASQYIWSMPNGLIVSDVITTSPSITADVVNGTGGVVTVMALGNTCGGSETIEQSSNPVTISGTPVNFHFIDHPQAACPVDVIKFSVNNIGVSQYIWTLPEGLGSSTIDDQDVTGISINGSWQTIARSNMVNSMAHYTNNDNANKKITYTPNLPFTGRYRVSVSYFSQWDTRQDVPVTINSADGINIQYINMQIPPSNGIWQTVGEYNFNAGTSGSVAIGANASGGSISVADAVKFEIMEIPDDTTITVKASEGLGGAVCVSVDIPQCTSRYTICTDPVNLAGTLQSPVFMEESNSVCEGLTYTFRASDIGAESYTWFLPPGMSIGGQTGVVPGLSREVMVSMITNTGSPVRIGVSGTISSCNIQSDTVYTHDILFNGLGCKLTTPVFTLQPAGICFGSNATFTVTAVQYAESYEWTVPLGLRQTGTLATGTIITNIPSIVLEPIGNLSGNLGTISVRAISSTITDSEIATSTPITVSSTPVFTISFNDITRCGTNNGAININGLLTNSMYSVSYSVNSINRAPVNMSTDAAGSIHIGNLSPGVYSNIAVSLAGCSSESPESHPISTPVTAQITGVSFRNPQVCGGTGSIAIALSGTTNGTIYSIDYNNDGSVNNSGTSQNDSIILHNIPVGTSMNQLAVINTNTNCSSSVISNGTILDPTPVNITGLNFISPDTCGGTGRLVVNVSGATENSLFLVDFENNGIPNDTGTVVSGSIILDKLPINTRITNLSLRGISSGCLVVSGLGGEFNQVPVAQINSVNYMAATRCGGTGNILIVTSGAANGTNYRVDLNNDGTWNGTYSVVNDTLTLTGLEINSVYSGLTIQDIQSRCKTISNASGTILAPSLPVISQVSFVNPVNCNETGSVNINVTGRANGELFNVDLNNDGSFINNLTLNSGVLSVSGIQPGDTIHGIMIENILSGCTATSGITGIIIHPTLPVVSVPDFPAVCANSPSQIISGGAPAGGTYSTNGVTINEINPSTLKTGSNPIVYTYTDTRNCTNTDTADLLVNPLPAAIITGEQMVCPESVSVPYSAENYTPGYRYVYSVTGGDFVSGESPAAILVTWGNVTNGNIHLVVTNMNTFCSDTSDYLVNIGDTETPVISNCISEYHLTAIGGEQARYHIFNYTDSAYIPKVTDNCSGSNLIFTFIPNNGEPVNAANYYGYRFNGLPVNTLRWVATDLSGNTSECVSTVYFDFEKVPPSAFSPNGDGVNDEWEIDFLSEFPEALVKVYNRWGVLVFESEKGYSKKWDGRSKGRMVPVDTYYYVISNAGSDKPFKGIVSVVY